MEVRAGQAGPPSHDQRSLDRALVRGVAWTGALRWATQVVSWAVTLVLARILTPADYGLIGLAMIYIGLLQLVNEFGLGAAIVRKRDLTEDQVAALGLLSILLGTLLWGLSALLAPLVASYFRAPDLRWPLTVLSVVFVTTALKVLPKSLLSRDLQFRYVATIDAAEAIIGALATLGFALAGFRYWALVNGTIVGALAGVALAFFWRRHRLAWPSSWASIAPAVGFGSHLMITRLAWYGYNNADNATVGRRLGQTLLGAYSYGWTIASIPVDRISALVGQVMPAIFSAVQEDPAALRRYLLRITEGLALITFPFALGLASVSDQFVMTLLGPRWWPAMPPLAILAFYAGFRSITTPYSFVLQTVGESARAMRQNLVGLAILLPLFILGSHFGLYGVALAWIVGYPFVAFPMLRAVLRVTHTSAADYFDAVRAPLRASLVMVAVVLAVRSGLPDAWPVPVQFGIAVAAGAITYAGVMFVAYRERVQGLWAMVRELRK